MGSAAKFLDNLFFQNPNIEANYYEKFNYFCGRKYYFTARQDDGFHCNR